MRKFITLVFCLQFAANLFAQNLANYTWDIAELHFSAPQGLQVTEKSDTKLALSNPNFSVVLEGVDNPSPGDDLKLYLVSLAKGYGLKQVSEADVTSVDLSGVVGLYVEGALDNRNILGVELLIDGDTGDSFTARLTYHPGGEKTATAVSQSFYIHRQ